MGTWVVLKDPDAFSHIHMNLDIILVLWQEEHGLMHIWAAGKRLTKTRTQSQKNWGHVLAVTSSHGVSLASPSTFLGWST